MKCGFESFLSQMKKGEEIAVVSEEYVQTLMNEIKEVVAGVTNHDHIFDLLEEKIKALNVAGEDAELRMNLTKQLGDKDSKIERLESDIADREQLLSEQQDKLNEANSALAKYRNQADEIGKEMDRLQEKVSQLENELLQAKRDKEEVSMEETRTFAATESEKAATNPRTKPFEQGMPLYYGIPVGMSAPVINASGIMIGSMPIEKTVKKSNGVTSLLAKLLFKKKSRQDIVKLVVNGELTPVQLEQIRFGIEQGLTKGQLLEIINSKASVEQMKEIIAIAVLENGLYE